MKILYISPIDSQDPVNGGYGFISRSFDKLFKSLKEKNIIEHYDLISLSTKQNKVQVIENYDVGIILTHPDSFDNPALKLNIENLRRRCKTFYLHIFWESSELPSKWDWLFGTNLFTGFIASSNFVKKLIQDKVDKFQSTQKVVKVYPLIDDIITSIDIEDKKKEDKFTVLYIGQYTKRKGFEDSLISFIHALGDKSDCQLYMKYHRLSQLEFEEKDLIQRTVAMNSKEFKAEIFTIEENLSRDQIYDLYKQSSVLLFLSRGEGFGLPLVEASMIGLPIIYADNSSCNEVVSGYNIHKVNCVEDLAVNMTHYSYEGKYGIPLLSQSVRELKNCYDQWKTNKEEYYNSNNGNTLRKLFSEDNIVKQIQQLG